LAHDPECQRDSPDQKTAIKNLLGRRVLEDEAISVRAIEPLGSPISGVKS